MLQPLKYKISWGHIFTFVRAFELDSYVRDLLRLGAPPEEITIKLETTEEQHLTSRGGSTEDELSKGTTNE